MIRTLLGFFLAWLALTPAWALERDDLFGVYLGYALVDDPGAALFQEREMTVEIEPYRRNGMRLRWTSVELVEGRRDRPGVNYRSDELLLLPSENGRYFKATVAHSPFSEEERDSALGGEPLRWAILDDEGLIVYSFVVLDDGRFELQSYRRALENDGMTLRFERIVDGEVVREVTGFARKAKQ